MTSASTMKAQRVDSARVLQLFLSRLVSCGTCRGDGAGRNAMCAGAEELPVFLESTGTVCRTATFSLPSLELKPRKKKFVHTTCIGSASTSMTSEARSLSVDNLIRPMRFNKVDIENAPLMAHENFLSSFQSIVDQRLQATAAMILKRTIAKIKTCGIDDNTSNVHVGAIRSLLPTASSNPTEIHAAVTNWTFSEPSQNDTEVSLGPKSSISQPIAFEALLHANILGNEKVTLQFSVPGNVSMVLSRFSGRIETVQINLNPKGLTKDIEEKARIVVRKTVRAAYKAAANKPVSPLAVEERQSDTKADIVVNRDRQMMPPPPPRSPKNRFKAKERRDGRAYVLPPPAKRLRRGARMTATTASI